MPPTLDPYRGLALTRLHSRPGDPLASALRAARGFVLLWSLLRLAACALRGFEFEGLLAAFIALIAVSSHSRSLVP